jgi:endonuclease I
MRKQTLFGFFIILTFSLKAQSPLPVSWDCEGNLPIGFSHNNLKYYAPSSFTCSSAPSLKFDNDGDFLRIYFAQRPGTLLYSIKSQSSYNGIFRIQESSDGVLWTTIKEYKNSTNPTITTTCKIDSAVPTLNSTRYLRFINASSINVEVDDISIKAPRILLPELYVSVNNVNIINNGNTPSLSTNVGSSFPYTLNFKNQSTSAVLKIDSVVISGAAKTDYSVGSSLPLNISASSNTNLLINFTPSQNGSRQALLKIYSNSNSNPVYFIFLNGVGGVRASEPLSSDNISSITYSNIKTYRYCVNVKAPQLQALDKNGGYLIVRTENTPLSSNPIDGTVYLKGGGFGNAKVVYVGAIKDSIKFYQNWVHAGKTYYYYAFPYNGNLNSIAYRYNDAYSSSVTTPETLMPSNEYTGVDPNSSGFVNQLTTKINPHTPTVYSEYEETMVDLFEQRDTSIFSNNKWYEKVITCQYSGLNQPYRYPLVWNDNDFSREHTYAHTWMPSYPADSPIERPEYNDQHHLFPTNQTKANAKRCNYPLGEVTAPSYTYLSCKLGLDAAGNKVFEPRNEHKGRAARALMYMSVCYNSSSQNWGYANRPPAGSNCSGNPISSTQDEYVIKKWNYLYPPTGYEMARNDFLDSLQGNRNPFVDHPEWGCLIDFKNMTRATVLDTMCQRMIGVNEQVLHINSFVFPNPAKDKVTIGILQEIKWIKIQLTSINGVVVANKFYKNDQTVFEETFDLKPYAKGIYILNILTDMGGFNRKIVVE